MPHFVILLNYTDQGVKAVKDTVKRADAYKAAAEKGGVKIHNLVWTLGRYDLVAFVEAADEVTLTAVQLSIASLGNVRSQTMRAFDSAEMKNIVGKMA
jgi:uncharacterized protein with GYD domain